MVQNSYYSEFNKIMEKKKRILKLQIKLSLIFDNTFHWLLVFLNLILLIIASVAIWWAVSIKTGDQTISFLKEAKITEEGFTYSVIVTSFMVVIFILSILITAYKATMRWSDYLKITTELQYLFVVNQDEKDYDENKFHNDCEKILNKYLKTKKKISWKAISIKTIKGDRGVK